MSTRKLAAILFADIVGYTALMQHDEQQALAKLQGFKEALEAQVPAHRGKIIQFYGDGCLAIFDSSVDAVSCAKLLQEGFVGELDVPVRLGLHTGEVMLKEGNVYGNAVNIASRVESMGVPGSVLLSSSIHNQVKNQSEFETEKLGRFEFKNVEGGMSVYALANKGLAIPQSGIVEGKFKKPAPTKSKRIGFFSVIITLAILLGIFAFWKNNRLTSPLTEAERQKRVAVMVFENKSGSEALEDFGTMISDWITKGLMETGKANIISAANVQPHIRQAGVGNVGSPALAEATGIGVTIQGRYYLQQDQLLIQANIVDAAKGEVIYALDPIQGDQGDMLKLLKQLTAEVLGYWAVKDVSRFLQNPPGYEAFQAYFKAFDYFATDFLAAEKLYIQAAALDTSFHAPLLKLIPLYRNNGRRPQADSIISLLKKKEHRFTQWELLRFHALIAEGEGKYLQAARLNEERYSMDSSDVNAWYNSFNNYVRANHPRKAIKIYNSFNDRLLLHNPMVDWRCSVITGAHLLLNEYQDVLDKIAQSNAHHVIYTIAKAHLIALIRMDSLEAATHQLAVYEQEGIYDHQDKKRDLSTLYRTMCEQAILLENDSLLTGYLHLYEKWIKESGSTSQFHQISLAFYQGKLDKTIELVEAMIQPETSSGVLLSLYSLLGYCHAMNHDEKQATDQLNRINEIKGSSMDILQMRPYREAIILAALGHKEKATKSLKSAMDAGFVNRLDLYKGDILLKPLFGYPPFEELVKPKG